MTDPEAVAAALARLVRGTAPARRPADEHHRTEERAPECLVTEAETALETLPAAAAFVEGGGERRLRRTIDEADAEVARRGQAVLAALSRLRSAAEPENPGEEGPARDDHFHRGRTTLLKGGDLATER